MTHATTRIAIAAACACLAGGAMAAEAGVGFHVLGSRTINAGMVAPPGVTVQASLHAFSGRKGASPRQDAPRPRGPGRTHHPEAVR